jgi:hypothetical protein
MALSSGSRVGLTITLEGLSSTNRPGLARYEDRSAGFDKSIKSAASGTSRRSSVDVPVWRAPNRM